MLTLVLIQTIRFFQETVLPHKLFSVVLLLAALCQTGNSRAEELLFPDKNFAITPPKTPNWQQPPKQPPGIILSLVTRDMARSFTVEVIEFDAQILNDSTISDITSHFDLSIYGTIKMKGNRYESRRLRIHGMPAYEISGVLEIDGKTRYLVVQYILANKHLYVLSALTDRNTLIQDQTLKKVRDSFRFINPPPPPSAFTDKGLLLIGAGAAIICLITVIVLTVRIAKLKKNEIQPL